MLKGECSEQRKMVVLILLVYPALPSPEIGRSRRLSSLCIVQPAPNARPFIQPHNTTSLECKGGPLSFPLYYTSPPSYYHDSSGAGTSTFSASNLNCAAFLDRSYRADVSPFHTVPSNRSQNVKNGCEKFVLIPQLWWWMSW